MYLKKRTTLATVFFLLTFVVFLISPLGLSLSGPIANVAHAQFRTGIAPLDTAISIGESVTAGVTGVNISPQVGERGSPSCTSAASVLANPGTCLVRSFFVAIGGGAMVATGWLMSMVGILFSFVVDITIVDFTNSVYEPIKSGIEVAWKAFRDVANIAIIGVFIFVAISTILGIEQFGLRRFIAKIIIVAVLLNFSLFFTKLVIDVSHVTAVQFYQGIKSNGGATAGTVSGPSLSQIETPDGIAGVFLNHMGITSVTDSFSLVNETIRSQNGILGLVYGLFGSALFLAVTAVLGYGAFLLISRAVVLVFLLLTSALAFASITMPMINGWWDKWITELLKTAFFAPLLMLFLWAISLISSSISQTQGGGGSLGALITNPSGTSNVLVLFNFFLILGLLYAAIRVANNLSIQGALMAPVGARLRAGSGLLLGGGIIAGARTAGAIGRSTRGIGAARELARMKRVLDEEKRAATPDEERRMRTLQRRATNSYDILSNKKLGGLVAKVSGIKTDPKVGAGGADATLKAQAEKAIEQAGPVAASEKQKEGVREQGENEIRHAQKTRRDTVDREKTKHEDVVKTGQREQRELTQQIEALNEQMARSHAGGDYAGAARAEGKAAGKQTELDAVNERILGARKKISQADRITKKLDKAVEKGGDAAVRAVSVEGIAERDLRNNPPMAAAFGSVPVGDRNLAAQKVSGLVKASKGEKSLKKMFKDYATTGEPPKTTPAPGKTEPPKTA